MAYKPNPHYSANASNKSAIKNVDKDEKVKSTVLKDAKTKAKHKRYSK